MSKRTSIVNALVLKLQGIDGTGKFVSNLFGEAFAQLKFWDETNNFPSVYVNSGTETRQYLPSDFTWGFLNITLRMYTKGENSSDQLEDLIADVESVIHDNRQLVYDADGNSTEEMLITSIVTDEGLLVPYAIGEINVQVRYQVT